MRTLKILLMASLCATAACGKKTAKTLPPPPPTTAPSSSTTPPSSSSGVTETGVRPGSPEDFRRSAGSDKVHFAYDSYEIDGENRGILDAQAAWLQKHPSVSVTIEGHADERGTREYNLALGERRANEVKNYLAGKGVSSGRISTISYGKERPEVEGSNEQSWAANRRAVTVLGGATG
ncbi:MAG: peptidoglycan-associated lipoprotein Pal [Sphingomonadaceae bacterium]|nr:peptidoglycan-associated lipoprotein Pal [Sphingomonadaceae bacterium]